MKMPKPRVVHSINFRILPLPDTVLMFDGQRYVVVGSMLHQKPDGSEVPLIRWRSHCADCGTPFECHTPLKATHPNRRCESHRRPGSPVSKIQRARQQRYLARHGPRRPKA